MRYEIVSYKPLIIFLSGVVLIGGGFSLGKDIKKAGRFIGEEEIPIYEAMVQTKGQNEYSSEEERRTFFENGDVMVIFPSGHPWTSGEKGELIVKLKIVQEEADRLMESEKKEAKGDSKDNPAEQIIRLRKYRINLDKIKTDQSEKIYDEQIIEKK